MLIHSATPPSLQCANKKPPKQNSQQLVVSCWLSTAIHRAFTVRSPFFCLAGTLRHCACECLRKSASLLPGWCMCACACEFSFHPWGCGVMSLCECRDLLPAVNIVDMICALDFNGSCVWLEQRAAVIGGGADVLLPQGRWTHSCNTYTDTHTRIGGLVKDIVKSIYPLVHDYKDRCPIYQPFFIMNRESSLKPLNWI